MNIDNIVFRSGIDVYTEPMAVVAETCNEDQHIQYIGYAKRGCQSIEDKKFCIVRVMCNRQTGITTYQYSNGSLERNVAFSERETLNYQFLI